MEVREERFLATESRMAAPQQNEQEVMSENQVGVVRHEVVSTLSATFTFVVHKHEDGNHSLRIEKVVPQGTASEVVTVTQGEMEDFHRAYGRAANLLRLETRGVWKIREIHRNAFYAWMEHEDQELQVCHNRGDSIATLSLDLGRSEEGIRARLVKLGLDPDRNTPKPTEANDSAPAPTGSKGKRRSAKSKQPVAVSYGFVDEIAGF